MMSKWTSEAPKRALSVKLHGATFEVGADFEEGDADTNIPMGHVLTHVKLGGVWFSWEVLAEEFCNEIETALTEDFLATFPDDGDREAA